LRQRQPQRPFQQLLHTEAKGYQGIRQLSGAMCAPRACNAYGKQDNTGAETGKGRKTHGAGL
jgi:hypothetical protein